MNFDDLIRGEIDSIKQELFDEVDSKIRANIPVDTGELLASFELTWEDNELVASTDTSYDMFVRFGHVTESGSIVNGNDYFDINLEGED